MTREEAIKAIKAWDFLDNDEKKVIETLIPELTESEDERIRKAILNYFTKCWGNCKDDVCGIHVEDVLAWLEKQNHDGKKWIYEDVYLKEKEQLIQDGIDEVLENPQKYGLEKQGEKFQYWKPSEEQLEALDYAYNSCPDTERGNYYEGVLETIIDELHKLSEKQGEKEQDPCEHCNDKCLNCHNFPCVDKREFERGKSAMEAIKEENANKIEPKFKVGDWVVSKTSNLVYHVDSILLPQSKCYYLSHDGCVVIVSFTDEQNYHLWTIADAKDGDVLATQGSVFIFKHLDKTGRSLCKSYCEVIDNSGLGLGFEFSINGVCPATKEQRDLLFAKMKEVGYEFDFEKKELKKFHIIDEGKDEMDYCFTKMMNGEKINSAWNEEDERIYYSLLADIKTRQDGSTNTLEAYYNEQIEWLKSLKSRVQPQNMWKPSKEQIVALRWILNNIPYNKHKEEISGLLDQIKHL